MVLLYVHVVRAFSGCLKGNHDCLYRRQQRDKHPSALGSVRHAVQVLNRQRLLSWSLAHLRRGLVLQALLERSRLVVAQLRAHRRP